MISQYFQSVRFRVYNLVCGWELEIFNLKTYVWLAYLDRYEQKLTDSMVFLGVRKRFQMFQAHQICFFNFTLCDKMQQSSPHVHINWVKDQTQQHAYNPSVRPWNVTFHSERSVKWNRRGTESDESAVELINQCHVICAMIYNLFCLSFVGICAWTFARVHVSTNWLP